MLRKNQLETGTHKHQSARTVDICRCGASRINGGEWIEGKDPNAVALGNKATAMSTPEERHEKAKSGGAERWKGKSRKERKEFMSWMASQPRPGRRIEDRCECGRFSRRLAEKRGHLCGQALAAKLEARMEAREYSPAPLARRRGLHPRNPSRKRLAAPGSRARGILRRCSTCSAWSSNPSRARRPGGTMPGRSSNSPPGVPGGSIREAWRRGATT